MSWRIQYLPETEKDMRGLDKAVREEVVKTIRRVSKNPGYPDGYGKPLSNQAGNDLAGLYKIKFSKAGVRVVYALKREAEKMLIIIIATRADEEVYKEATKRRVKHDL
jgi:mRNA interferase RelE/StbE